jgi:lactose/cellobiose-specific phosphotransferase system IIC component
MGICACHRLEQENCQSPPVDPAQRRFGDGVAILRRVQLWMIAIRDSFITLLPITFFGVFALLVKDLPLPVYQSMMTEYWGGDWQKYLQLIVEVTHGLFGVTLCALLAVHVASHLKRPGSEELPHLTVAIFGLTNFMILAVARGPLSTYSLGHDSILIAIAVGIFSAEALRWAAETWWLNPVRMPYDTDPTFYHAIRLTPPFIAIGLTVAAAAFGLALLPASEADPWQDLIEMAQSHGGGAWWLSSIAVLINQMVWFLGAHGGHVLDTYASSLFSPPGTPYGGTLAWRPMFDAFALLGGSGATFGLIVAIAIAVKAGPNRKLAQLSILPGIFNINETILYGLPVVLNPLYLLPFVAVPLLLSLLTLASVNLGFMEFQAVTIPWTTPPIISGWMLTGSWRGAAFQVVEICLSTALYLPFVRRVEAKRLHDQMRVLAETTETILSERRARVPVVKRHDQIGLMARGLLGDLRIDLARNALKLAYQPKHALDGRIVGVEALLRWTHHRYGELSPAMAITLAEDSGDIHWLGRWALEQACACKARWNMQGFKQLRMAVNVSPLQLTDREFVPRLASMLVLHDLSPDEIELELIESLHIPNTIVVDAALRRLSELGVRLAVDDFGMGYSSLLHLRRFHVHSIKIDGSLTSDVLSNRATANIIRTIASLGRAQDMDVVAEYVETQAQRDVLIKLGCDCFQGNLYSAGLGEAECLEYLETHRSASEQM